MSFKADTLHTAVSEVYELCACWTERESLTFFSQSSCDRLEFLPLRNSAVTLLHVINKKNLFSGVSLQMVQNENGKEACCR